MIRLFQILLILSLIQAKSQHTFSIVAVDSLTKEVGAAGATCLSVDKEGAEALIISRLHPGIGAINTQSYWNQFNQDFASNLLLGGFNSEEIIESLKVNDSDNNPSIRQYGVVHLNSAGHPDAAGFTGSNCLNYKKHIAGRYYSIQGNILLGEYIVDSMESQFLRAKGSLADRLMEAMKGAKIAGADSRCLSEGLSSRSSFLRVAQSNDSLEFDLDIHVPSTRKGVDPIDSLERLYSQWKKTNHFINTQKENLKIYYSTQDQTVSIIGISYTEDLTLDLVDFYGKTMSRPVLISENRYKISEQLAKGLYILQLSQNNIKLNSIKIVIQ
ncbi:MAG: DUF1028 domain-containing protein [Saprospiraceae bacterium]|nr:DUF1028 domain-containing protein [Saprospiraceae bacterium]